MTTDCFEHCEKLKIPKFALILIELFDFWERSKFNQYLNTRIQEVNTRYID